MWLFLWVPKIVGFQVIILASYFSSFASYNSMTKDNQPKLFTNSVFISKLLLQVTVYGQYGRRIQ